MTSRAEQLSSKVLPPYPLGAPLPPSNHAVSVSLPRWEDVIGYEEKKPVVKDRLLTGYPRFFTHRRVADLAKRISGNDELCLPFPSARVAESCARYIQRRCGKKSQVIPGLGAFGVMTGHGARPTLQEFWQHTGLIVSSRQADSVLSGRKPQPDPEVALALQTRLADWYDCSPDDILLQPTGMAAQYAALRAVMERAPGRATAQLGFPYVDTFKLQERLGVGGHMLHRLGTIETELRERLAREPLAGCFCEIPGNPLLGSADLRRVTPILRERAVPLIVDDVVATPYNIDVGAHADLVATSLTKFIAGSGDVMGGALICNPRSPFYAELKAIAKAQHEDLLWCEDAVRLEELSRDFPERMKGHNANGLLIAERLRAHPAIERVWYPRWEFNEAYESVRRKDGGWGALVTFLPRKAEATAPRIYDALRVCKGPSLGTVFTLACPFTLLAHYTELDWAEACGVPRNLLRISVGLEDPEALWNVLKAAIESA